MSNSACRQSIRPKDVVSEAVEALRERVLRSFLTAFGTALGIASLLAIVGLTSSADAHVSNRFDALAATTVSLQDQTPGEPGGFPLSTDATLQHLNGVVAAGLLWNVDSKGKTVSAGIGPAPDLSGGIYAASAGLFAAVGAHFSMGVAFDNSELSRAAQVVILGKEAARELGIKSPNVSQAVKIDGIPFTVQAIMDDSQRRPDLLLGVLVPITTAAHLWGGSDSEQAIIATSPGAAELIGRQAPVALHPEQPGRLVSLVPPDPRLLRSEVGSDLRFLLLGLSAVSLVVGMVSIANTTLVSVMERVPEIGLRRAQGARRRDIRRQFLVESAVLGAVGGIIGIVLGLVVITVFCFLRQWTAVLNLSILPGALILGVVVGITAGVYPAAKAARYSPAEALRR